MSNQIPCSASWSQPANVWRLGVVLAAVLVVVMVGQVDWVKAQASSALEERVYEAALITYIHGMTEDIARQEFGPEAIPVLLDLLNDPTFPRRDNVVAVLGYLGGPEATQGLLNLLRTPPASVLIPEEDRALLLAPQSLGQIASRGDAAALQALLEMTEHNSNGGLLSAAAARGPRPAALRDDLLGMALRGLAFSGAPQAQERLEAIANGNVKPAPNGRNLQPLADTALEVLEQVHGRSVPSQRGGTPFDHDGSDPSLPVSPQEALDGSGSVEGAFDGNHTQVFNTRLTYANHPAVANPMTDSSLDAVLASVSLHMGRAEFTADVACCAGLQREGTAQSFGSLNDGLDVIDNSTELNAVLNNSVARVKVVRTINYCGGTGTNIIGCAWVGGHGIAVVRFGTVSREGALWAHEYGHNAGLSHNTTSSNYIMYGSLGSSNTGLTQSECDRYHTPSSAASASRLDLGACTDVDIDDVQDVVDNCPGVANNDQTDANSDGIGDVCESGCGNGIIDIGEACDGPDLGGQTCADFNFDEGTLGCNQDCTFNTSDCTTCGDGVQNGSEACDGSDLGGASCSDLNCSSGTPTCTNGCSLDYTTCGDCPICDNDGVCEAGEDCHGCPNDCLSGSGATCGNGICEAGNGEDCVSCPQDCNGQQSGKPSGRYCCGDGGGQNPIGCSDNRCTAGGTLCTHEPAAPSCCGDTTCEGIETSFNCEVDCGPAPFCGDGFCDSNEDECLCPDDCGLPLESEESCTDGVDNDCNLAVDCDDTACANDPACNATCEPIGAVCTSNSDCCSNKCRGKGGAQTCR